MPSTTISTLHIKTLDDLRAELRKIFSSDDVDVDYLKECMEAYVSNPQDWRQYAKVDATKHYTRNLVDDGNGKYNLMILCWNEGSGSSIHSHANAHCFMKVIAGSLREIQYEWPKEGEEDNAPLRQRCVGDMPTNAVAYINDSIGLHRVENFSHTDTACSLHLYCPPYSKCDTFDERTGHRIKCNVTFYSKFGRKLSYTNAHNHEKIWGQGDQEPN